MQSRMGHLKTSTHISRNKKGGRILPPFVAKPSVKLDEFDVVCQDVYGI